MLFYVGLFGLILNVFTLIVGLIDRDFPAPGGRVLNALIHIVGAGACYGIMTI